jgi:hypothetical protein
VAHTQCATIQAFRELQDVKTRGLRSYDIGIIITISIISPSGTDRSRDGRLRSTDPVHTVHAPEPTGFTSARSRSGRPGSVTHDLCITDSGPAGAVGKVQPRGLSRRRTHSLRLLADWTP